MSFPTAHYADSDADDEYERSVLASPHIHTDDDTSPTDSDPPSTEPTPTFGHIDGEKMSPGTLIIEWTAGQCADYVSSLGLPQYRENFLGMIPLHQPTRFASMLIDGSCRKRDCW